jgi:hypothetical protein
VNVGIQTIVHIFKACCSIGRLTNTISGKLGADQLAGGDDIVAKTLFLDNLAEDMHKLVSVLAKLFFRSFCKRFNKITRGH